MRALAFWGIGSPPGLARAIQLLAAIPPQSLVSLDAQRRQNAALSDQFFGPSSAVVA